MSETDAARADGGRVRDEGYDDFLDALESGEGYYLECSDEHGWLPPRRVCPECGGTDLEEAALPDYGEIETLTTVHVAAPSFADDAPYVTAVADFDGVRLTGVVRGADSEDVDVGTEVSAEVGETETADERVLVLHAE